MFALHCGSEVTFSGEQQPAIYSSSEWAERGFCPVCGTHLFYHLWPANEYIWSAGLFAESTAFELNSQIFIDHKPDFYALSNETETLTEAQVFACYSETDH